MLPVHQTDNELCKMHAAGAPREVISPLEWRFPSVWRISCLLASTIDAEKLRGFQDKNERGGATEKSYLALGATLIRVSPRRAPF